MRSSRPHGADVVRKELDDFGLAFPGEWRKAMDPELRGEAPSLTEFDPIFRPVQTRQEYVAKAIEKFLASGWKRATIDGEYWARRHYFSRGVTGFLGNLLYCGGRRRENERLPQLEIAMLGVGYDLGIPLYEWTGGPEQHRSAVQFTAFAMLANENNYGFSRNEHTVVPSVIGRLWACQWDLDWLSFSPVAQLSGEKRVFEGTWRATYRDGYPRGLSATGLAILWANAGPDDERHERALRYPYLSLATSSDQIRALTSADDNVLFVVDKLLEWFACGGEALERVRQYVEPCRPLDDEGFRYRHMYQDPACIRTGVARIQWAAIEEARRAGSLDEFERPEVLWRKYHHRMPSGPNGTFLSRSLDVGKIKGFPLRLYEEIVAGVTSYPRGISDENVWTYRDVAQSEALFFKEWDHANSHHAAIGLMSVFGKNWRWWPEFCVKKRRVGIHSATHWLPNWRLSGFDAYISKHRDAAIDDLAKIAVSWNNIEEADRGLPVKKLVIKIGMDVLANAGIHYESKAFAETVLRYQGVPQKEVYEECEGRWMTGIASIDREDIPHVVVNADGYRMYTVDREDPRGLLAGFVVPCCQHPGGAADSSAWYGATRPDSGFFFIEDPKGEVIAQSWAWVQYQEGRKVLVFDNIEAKGFDTPARAERIVAMYDAMGNELIGRMGIDEVRVGTGYVQGGILAMFKAKWTPAKTLTETPRTDYHLYSDARGHQFVIRSAEADA